MIPSYYSRLRTKKLPSATIAERYVKWALGLDDYRGLRGRRLKSGVLDRWSLTDFLDGGSFHGQYDARAETRRDENRFVLHLTHRDDETPEVFWHTVVRITDESSETHVEHGSARTVPRDYRLTPLTSSPRIVRDIATDPKGDVRPRVFNALIRIRSGEVDDFVKYVLLDRERELPFVVISPTREGGFLVDADDMAMRLATLASVGVLETEDSTFALSDSLRDRGYPDIMSRCFGGAVRVYGPVMHPDDPAPHYMWLPTRIGALGQASTEALAGAIAGHVLTTTLPRGFFYAVQEFDRAVSRDRMRLLVEQVEAEASERGATATDLRERLAEEAKLQDQLVNQLADLENQLESRTNELRAAEQIRDQTEEAYRHALSEGARSRQADLVRGMSDPLRSCARALLSRSISLPQTLDLLAALFPDEVIVLQSARESAEDASEFTKPEDAWDLLYRLANEYPAVVSKGGDDAARKIFGKSFAATESETVRKNDSAMKMRTFDYDGTPTLMLRHLKIGRKESIHETLRIHFHWDDAKKRVVIGHCGKHLDFD